MQEWWEVDSGHVAFGPEPSERTTGELRRERFTVIVDLNDPKQYPRFREVGILQGKKPDHLNDAEVQTYDGYEPVSVEKLDAIARRVKGLVQAGEKVFVHCIGGKGRSPTVAAAYLILCRKPLSAAEKVVMSAPWKVWDGHDAVHKDNLAEFARRLGK